MISSCAKVGYLVEQGTGQVKLLATAKDNEKILNDVRFSKKHKEKIKKIQVYKSYFYKYWNKKETSIYSKTTMLHDPAVTYLVISSDFNKVEAREECFPIMGCFPYLGFFKKSSATSYANDLKTKGIVTYTRPVYAYSTLGYFTDTILSSFFYFDDFELAELIFHELFHTVFFVKDEVELNENLANYFGKQMAIEYFKDDIRLKERIKEESLLSKAMSKELVDLARKLDKGLRSKKFKNIDEAKPFVDSFLSDKIKPKLRSVCHEFNVADEKCYYLNRKWNQASLAAFMTYENKVDELLVLRNRISGDLKDFFHYIEKEFNEFKSAKEKKSFSKWLFGKNRSNNEKAHTLN
ncbi:aminopeptidase [Halobacteriovorax sp.]|uniref:aminopeptidase n=1 Tax=Halobacteriovorax sp. TaxID=2020862 RepID=UPI00356396B8